MDEAKIKYRHELKYVSSEMELALVKGRLDHLISLDSHVKEKGIYSIRSLYFDDYDGRCYDENESGSDPREKFRIRIYNAGTGRISLELKRKEHGMTQKLSCRPDRGAVQGADGRKTHSNGSFLSAGIAEAEPADEDETLKTPDYRRV